MRATTTFWAKLLRKSNPEVTSIVLQDEQLLVEGRHGPKTFDLSNLPHLVEDRGLIWSSIRIEASEQAIEVHGIPKSIASRFVAETNNQVLEILCQNLNQCRELFCELRSKIETLASGDHYIAHHHIQPIIDSSCSGPVSSFRRSKMGSFVS